ncbi:flagellar motor switch protein FliG [Christensenella intestinihominis]|uniref:flagellar motor switch protein FliG n=1 Tax=Christensenella intestinihominis TaxID=1851429 RepID=UPI0009F50AE6|nr:flagellar motor switch protein FliG [Christensenella intestinihominis]
MVENLLPKEKAAILMVVLGKDISSKIYKHLTEDEIEQLTLGITGLRSFDKETRDAVVGEFYDLCVAQKYISEGGIDYARDVLVKAVGDDKADELIGKLSAALQVRPFDFVRKADTAQISNLIQNEHPQTIALILSYLKPEQAAGILSTLPEELQAKVVERVADMGVVSMEYIREAERILEYKISSMGQEESTTVGGVDMVVEMLAATDRNTEKHIMDTVEEDNPDLADEIHKRMFVFEDIVKLGNADLQKVLKEIDNDILTIALKGAAEEIAEKIYANISKRLHDLIVENMEYMGPVRVRDVEQAQQTIVNVIRKLEDAGEIEISRGGAEDELIV